MWPIVLTSLGGLVAFLSAALMIIRAVFRNVDATKDNTKAITGLTDKMTGVDKRVGQLEIWQAVMEDRRHRR